MIICNKLKDYIYSMDINIYELAEKVDYDDEFFYRQLNGELELDTESLADICRALNITASMFYE